MLDYLFLDASFFRMHPGSPAEPVLAAWGITTDGKPVFVGLAPGTGESTDGWADVLTDLRDRGLTCPLLVVSDGARGLIAAIEQVFPHALRQRCLIHRVRNVLAKTPAGMQAEIRDGYWACFDTEDLNTEPGPRLVESVDARLTAFVDRYAAISPGGDEDPDHRPRGPDRLSAVSDRASSPHPAFELHRAHLRRNPPPRKGYRPISR
jgi:putative transposase